MSLGAIGGSVQPHYDEDGNQTYTTYGIRSGYLQKNLTTQVMQKRKFYYKREMKGRVGYKRFKIGDPVNHDLKSLLDDLEIVRTDDRFAGVVLNLSGMGADPAAGWELREKLKEIQKSGKKVTVFIDGAGIGTYSIASVADAVILDPAGGIELPGLAVGRTYYRHGATPRRRRSCPLAVGMTRSVGPRNTPATPTAAVRRSSH